MTREEIAAVVLEAREHLDKAESCLNRLSKERLDMNVFVEELEHRSIAEGRINQEVVVRLILRVEKKESF